MALTRSFLKALGIEEEKIGEIINAHSETVSGLKAEIEKYKGDALLQKTFTVDFLLKKKK